MAWYDELARVGDSLSALSGGIGKGADTYYGVLDKALRYNNAADIYDANKNADLFNLQAMLAAEQAKTNTENQRIKQLENELFLNPEYRAKIAELTGNYGFGTEDFNSNLINFAGQRGNMPVARGQQPYLKQEMDRQKELSDAQDQQTLIEAMAYGSLKRLPKEYLANLPSHIQNIFNTATQVYKDEDGQYIVVYGDSDEEVNLEDLPGGVSLLSAIQAQLGGKSAQDIQRERLASAVAARKAEDSVLKTENAAERQRQNFYLSVQKFLSSKEGADRKLVQSKIISFAKELADLRELMVKGAIPSSRIEDFKKYESDMMLTIAQLEARAKELEGRSNVRPPAVLTAPESKSKLLTRDAQSIASELTKYNPGF